MAGRRVGTLAAAFGAGGIGYYLYSAGGDPKLAEKKFERVCHSHRFRCISLTSC